MTSHWPMSTCNLFMFHTFCTSMIHLLIFCCRLQPVAGTIFGSRIFNRHKLTCMPKIMPFPVDTKGQGHWEHNEERRQCQWLHWGATMTQQGYGCVFLLHFFPITIWGVLYFLAATSLLCPSHLQMREGCSPPSSSTPSHITSLKWANGTLSNMCCMLAGCSWSMSPLWWQRACSPPHTAPLIMLFCWNGTLSKKCCTLGTSVSPLSSWWLTSRHKSIYGYF